MPSRQVEKIYIDTNIWFAYIVGIEYDRQSEKACRLINEIKDDQDKTAVISILSHLELTNSMRQKIVQRTKYDGRLNEDNRRIEVEIKNRIESYIKNFVDVTTQWEKAAKLEIADITRPMGEILLDAYSILNVSFGSIKQSNQCRICRNNHDSYSYRGVDHWDIQHAIIAKDAQVTELATFDGGFRQLGNYFDSYYRIKVY